MMHIRIVRMRVCCRFVVMLMCMRLGAVPRKIVLVLMMHIVPMRMAMRHRFVCVFVFVALGEMQPNAARHQCCGNPECRRRLLVEQRNRECSADEGCRREVSAGTRGAEAA